MLQSVCDENDNTRSCRSWWLKGGEQRNAKYNTKDEVHTTNNNTKEVSMAYPLHGPLPAMDESMVHAAIGRRRCMVVVSCRDERSQFRARGVDTVKTWSSPTYVNTSSQEYLEVRDYSQPLEVRRR